MWRDTSRDITVLGLDAWALLGLFAIPFSGWSMTGVYICVGLALFSAIIRLAGLNVVSACRRLICIFIGPERPATPFWKRRDYT